MKSLPTLVLSATDTRAVVERVGLDVLMDELIARLVSAFRDFDDATAHVPARAGFHYSLPEPGLLEWMPVLAEDSITIKLVGYHPRNPATRALPTILATIGRWDQQTGHWQAVADGTLLTAMRTAAASAVATRLLAAPDGRVLGIIGAGAQAVTQAHAVSRVCRLQRILVSDSRPEVARSFVDRVAFLGVDTRVVTADALQQLTGEADILCTCTSVGIGRGPVFADEGLRPWLHVNAVGSDFRGKVEVPLSLLRRALVVPDSLEQATAEGECQLLAPSEIGPRLASIAKHPERYAAARTMTTVFDSTGWAVEDHVVLSLFIDHARRLGLGSLVDVEGIPSDPYDPYEGLKPAGGDSPSAGTAGSPPAGH